MKQTTKKRAISIFLIFAFCGVGCFAWLMMRPDPGIDPYFICGYPPLQQVKGGLSKTEVAAILGKPAKEKLNYELKDYRSGSSNPKILPVERCIYEIKGWHGNIEVYFNSQGKMVGKDCGFG